MYANACKWESMGREGWRSVEEPDNSAWQAAYNQWV